MVLGQEWRRAPRCAAAAASTKGRETLLKLAPNEAPRGSQRHGRGGPGHPDAEEGPGRAWQGRAVERPRRGLQRPAAQDGVRRLQEREAAGQRVPARRVMLIDVSSSGSQSSSVELLAQLLGRHAHLDLYIYIYRKHLFGSRSIRTMTSELSERIMGRVWLPARRSSPAPGHGKNLLRT